MLLIILFLPLKPVTTKKWMMLFFAGAVLVVVIVAVQYWATSSSLHPVAFKKMTTCIIITVFWPTTNKDKGKLPEGIKHQWKNVLVVHNYRGYQKGYDIRRRKKYWQQRRRRQKHRQLNLIKTLLDDSKEAELHQSPIDKNNQTVIKRWRTFYLNKSHYFIIAAYK